MGPIDFNSIFPPFYLTHILQNILFCVQQKKEVHTGLKQG